MSRTRHFNPLRPNDAYICINMPHLGEIMACRHQTIILTNADILDNWTPGNIFQRNPNKNAINFIKKSHLKISANRLQFCLSLDVLTFYMAVGYVVLSAIICTTILVSYLSAQSMKIGHPQASFTDTRSSVEIMMTSANGNIFRVTGPLCGEFTGHRWIPRTKASDAEPWCFLWSARE